jgi:glycogen synthase
MHIVFISSEMTPIAKAGGLADVVLGLSKALQVLGQSRGHPP